MNARNEQMHSIVRVCLSTQAIASQPTGNIRKVDCRGEIAMRYSTKTMYRFTGDSWLERERDGETESREKHGIQMTGRCN